MIKHNFVVKVDNNLVFTKEGETYPTFKDARQKVDMELWRLLGWQQMKAAKPGQKGSVNLTISWECTMNGRAPARPKDVIAAEKAVQATKAAARAAERKRVEQYTAQLTINKRKRIKSQVDHAFGVGKHGTECASKYITCEHCDAPAAVLMLTNAPARNAHVLDEDTITGALCVEHNTQWAQREHQIQCAKLEFFYDGVRQIVIKP